MRNTSNPPTTKVAKFMYVPKNKGESSSKENAGLKSICVHPNFFAIIKEPFATNEFLDFLPRSLIINKKRKLLRDISVLLKNYLPKMAIPRSILVRVPS